MSKAEEIQKPFIDGVVASLLAGLETYDPEIKNDMERISQRYMTISKF